MAVGLGQHERDPQAQRGQSDRRGHVPAAAEHGVWAQPLQDRPCPRDGPTPRAPARGSHATDCLRLYRLRPRSCAAHTPPSALAPASARSPTDERDLGAVSPQRVCHRQRRRHVPGGSPRGDRDPRLCPFTAPSCRFFALFRTISSKSRHGPHMRRSARGHVQQQPHRRKHHDQAARPVGHERQRHARQRRQPEHGEHVQQRLGDDQRGDADRDQRAVAGCAPLWATRRPA